MTIADTSVKWFHSEMPDAPALSGTAGSLINLLDACLLDGFSSRVADSVSVADGVATVTLSAGNPYEKHAVIEISGALPAELNRQWRIASATPTEFTFVVDDVVAAGLATGTIMVKRAAAGWVKPFADTNRAVYQSAALDSTQLYLYLDDTDPRYTRVRGHEHVVDIDTREGPFPTLAQLAANNMTWAKSSTANATARRWVVLSDGHFFWFMPAWHATYPAVRTPHNFGDVVGLIPGDAYHCLLTAHAASAPNNPGASHVGTSQGRSDGRYFARPSSATGEPVAAGGNNIVNDWAHASAWAPAVGGGDILIGPPPIIQDGTAATAAIRGLLPGPRMLYQFAPFSDGEIVIRDDQVFMSISLIHPWNTSTVIGAFDITGPWR